MKIGINATRARSGGAKAHLIGILSDCDPTAHGFQEVHVWSYRELLDLLPSRPWLFKHCPSSTTLTVLQQLWWERFDLANDLRDKQCDIVLNVDAGTVNLFSPSVTISQDLLSFDPGEINRYGCSKAWLRLILLRYIQNQSLRKSSGAIFLTHYAAKIVQHSCGPLYRLAVIPHGVSELFKRFTHKLPWPANGERPIRLLYISNADLYKHQWNVIKAVENLRNQGFNIILKLVGGGCGPAQDKLSRQALISDPEGKFITQIEFMPQHNLLEYFSESDIFVFASSCEAFGITLLEAIAVGIPIACSCKSSLPEILDDGGIYFDPENPKSIVDAIRRLIENPNLRQSLAKRAKELASKYSWKLCANSTWDFVEKTCHTAQQQKRIN